jgi:hypothetical protein
MIGKLCSKCGKEPQLKQKTICKSCDAKRVAERRKTNKKLVGNCVECGIVVYELRNEFKLCSTCYNKKMSEQSNNSKYQRAKTKEYQKMHIRIAEYLTGGSYTEDGDNVVHHLDENKSNNHPSNLIIISREAHSNLHIFLKKFKLSYTGKEPWEKVRLEHTFKFLDLYRYEYESLGKYYEYGFPTRKAFVDRLLNEQIIPGHGGIHEEGNYKN